jgi:hypothetical protein
VTRQPRPPGYLLGLSDGAIDGGSSQSGARPALSRAFSRHAQRYAVLTFFFAIYVPAVCSPWKGLCASVSTRREVTMWYGTQVVDTSLGDKLNISLNITFHALTCLEVNVDAMDVAGDNQMHIEHAMLKQRLTGGEKRVGSERGQSYPIYTVHLVSGYRMLRPEGRHQGITERLNLHCPLS